MADDYRSAYYRLLDKYPTDVDEANAEELGAKMTGSTQDRLATLAGWISGGAVTGGIPTPRYGSMQIAQVVPDVVDPTVISRALRAMGREALNYMRKTGQKVDVIPAREAKEAAFIAGNQRHLVKLGKNVDEAAPFHEMTGHLFEAMLPRLTKQRLQEAQKAIPSRFTKMAMKGVYKESEVPGEAFAYAREPKIAQGAVTHLSDAERAAANTASRDTRKSLKEIMRRAFEDEPAEAAAEATPDLMSLLRNMGPRVDPNAEVFEKNARVIRPLLGGNK